MSVKNLFWVGLVALSLASTGCGGGSTEPVVNENVPPVMTAEEADAYQKAEEDYQKELLKQ